MQRDAGRIYDEYLVSAARSGDRAAWERLVQRWQPRLLRHALRLSDGADSARDSTQEAWIEIFRGLHRLDDVVAFPAWALRIVTRRCQRAWRRQDGAAEESFDERHELPLPEQDSAEFAVDLQTALDALRQLPPSQRATLALYHLDHLSVAEIAIALDVPPGTVKTRLMHARRKLRAMLDPEQGAHHGQA
ncbi:RNA polymerase sigma factor [Pseudomarimonas salicorniae]|uniref:Sigma-70 family RNA polymerase sigma factor n=1 Tax=Pseudomarimonas salicorniae TaxID=2933270 RepID=A0ABT0GJW8_9GAMM|nr:sigma-70 family RNA polymerase sigma factor [Lysobacter sp. CAU 1642]MCK7594833.1 sigma-70 family RNA polymerase sigma factor [Lysobacter sp. CAU 1642]